MTWHLAPQLQAIAAGAGWLPPDDRIAAAVALVASGGADHFHVCPPTAPTITLRGLWALDHSHVTPTDRTMGFGAKANAQAAYYAWQGAGGNWDWHPAWARDGGATVRQLVTDLTAGGGWARSPVTVSVTLDRIQRLQHTAQRIRDLRPTTWSG